MTLQQWLQQGELLHETALQEYRALESQLDDVQRRLAAKRSEVNQIAAMLGKANTDGNRQVTAQIITPQATLQDTDRVLAKGTTATIARALTGKAVTQPL
jgi:hypothetical protein